MASGSKSNTSTSSSQSTRVNELNLQDTGGITVADNKGSTQLAYTNVSTDEGATSAAIAANTKLSSDVSSAAVTLGTTAIDSGTEVANHGLDNAAAAYSAGLDFGNNALNTVANLLQDSAQREESLTASALQGYQSIAQQNSASDSTQIQKIALYAIAAAVALVVLPKMLDS